MNRSVCGWLHACLIWLFIFSTARAQDSRGLVAQSSETRAVVQPSATRIVGQLSGERVAPSSLVEDHNAYVEECPDTDIDTFVISFDAVTGRFTHGYTRRDHGMPTHPLEGQRIILCVTNADLRDTYRVTARVTDEANVFVDEPSASPIEANVVNPTVNHSAQRINGSSTEAHACRMLVARVVTIIEEKTFRLAMELHRITSRRMTSADADRLHAAITNWAGASCDGAACSPHWIANLMLPDSIWAATARPIVVGDAQVECARLLRLPITLDQYGLTQAPAESTTGAEGGRERPEPQTTTTPATTTPVTTTPATTTPASTRTTTQAATTTTPPTARESASEEDQMALAILYDAIERAEDVLVLAEDVLRRMRTPRTVFELGIAPSDEAFQISVHVDRVEVALSNDAIRVEPTDHSFRTPVRSHGLTVFRVEPGLVISPIARPEYSIGTNEFGATVLRQDSPGRRWIHPAVMLNFHWCRYDLREGGRRRCARIVNPRFARLVPYLPTVTVGIPLDDTLVDGANFFIGTSWNLPYVTIGFGAHIANNIDRLRPGYFVGDPFLGNSRDEAVRSGWASAWYLSITMSNDIFARMRGYEAPE